MQRMAAADALSYWMAPIIPNDQFAVYVFAHREVDDPRVLAAWLAARAQRVRDLRLRVLDVPLTLDRPYWVTTDVRAEQFVVDDVARTWQQCLAALAQRMSDQLDPTDMAWRVHVFAPVSGVPGAPDEYSQPGEPISGCGGPTPAADSDAGVVVVLQISHALGDGRRSAEIARELFGTRVFGAEPRRSVTRAAPDSALRVGSALLGAARFPGQFASMVARGVVAWRRHRVAPVEHGGGVALSRVNKPSGRSRTLRTLTVERRTLRIGGCGVTVGALVAISLALPRFLADVDDRLVVELTVARSPRRGTRNNFRNVGIDLRVDEPDLCERARRIAADIDTARRCDDDPTRVASRAATAATPAALTRWGIAHFDPEVVPERVTGVTVVSSVDRGPADLMLDGRPVLATAGFPALSPVQGLTHGVHGIGDRVTISVTTSPEVCPDVDAYLAGLSEAIDRLARAGSDNAVRAGRAGSAPDRARSEGNSATRG